MRLAGRLTFKRSLEIVTAWIGEAPRTSCSRVRVGGAGARERPAGGDRRRARAGRALGRGARGGDLAERREHLAASAGAGAGRSCALAPRGHARLLPAGERAGRRAVGGGARRRRPACRRGRGARGRVSGRARRRSSSCRPRSSQQRLERGERGRARRAPGGGVPRRAHRRRRVGAVRRAAGVAGELPRRREIVAYCRGPYCVYADDAVRLLRERGLQARRLDVGFPEWRRAGLPVEIGRAERRLRCCCARS